ncbi:MAG: hypothetical protein FWE38_04400 [Firmicutes bacterium]|nr:hypothetical protein [Bacillota bacterium]
MGPWLMSIAGVVIVGVVVELLLTDSAMSKFVRGIYAFFILLVIVAPIPNLIRDGEFVGGEMDVIDWDLIGSINNMTVGAAQTRATDALARAGFDNAIVVIWHDRNATNLVIERAFVNAAGHINARDQIIRIVTTVLNIDEGRIEFHA